MISIIMPVKDAGLFLGECLDSIREQTLTEWELLAVNDHAADDSAAILERYSQADPRIRLFHNPGAGILPALQFAQEQAAGEFITRMDADDRMPPNKLALLLNQLTASPDRTVATGKVSYFSENPVSDGYRRYENWLNTVVDRGSFFDEIYRECTIASPNWMMRRKAFDSFGGFRHLVYPEDYDLVFQLRANDFRVVGTNHITHLWREHPHRASRNLEAYQQTSFFRLKTAYFLKSEALEHRSLMLWGAGKKGKLVAKQLLASHREFTWMDWNSERYKAGVYHLPIKPLVEFDGYQDPLVISTISPPPPQQERIDLFLAEKGLIPGRNYFVF